MALVVGPAQHSPAPCPACDAEIPARVAQASNPACPECGIDLTPARVASTRQRLLGFAVDATILLCTAVPINLMLLALGTDEQIRLDRDGVLSALAHSPIEQLLAVGPTIAMTSLYFIAFHMIGGRSPGQILAKTRLVDTQGRLPSMSAIALRTAYFWLGLAPAGLGSVWLAFDDQRRSLHDTLAGTFVLDDA